MRKLYYLLIFIFSFSVLSAQEKLSKEEQARREKNIQAGNPFAKYGYKAKVATLSKGKYLEFHDLDSIVTIGTMRWHVDKNQIVGRIEIDTLNPDAQPIGDAPGRWMSPDPLSEEFPEYSPYNMSFNNPIRFVDPDGKAPKDVTPYLVRHLNKPSLSPVYERGVLSKQLGATMREIMKTDTGKNYISQFMNKGDAFYGYKASKDGKYSDVMLNITEYNLQGDDKKYESAVGFATREGVVSLSEADGHLMINIYTNSTNVEAISHELFVHNAGDIDGIISAYRKGGLEAAQKASSQSSADDDHRALRDLNSNHRGIKMYKDLAKELEVVNPNNKKTFEAIKKVNETKYENLGKQ